MAQVAAGWERRRALFWDATRPLSERMVELLDPQPGETILELAAGPGDTGFLAAGLLGADGRLLSTDAAEEMVAVARRRASELGVTNAEFRVLDAAAIDLADESVDGVLCRFGLMLVDDPGRGFAEVRRVLRPGRVASIAVWAEPARNEWMTAAGRSAVELGLMELPDPDAPGPFRLSDPALLESFVAGSRADARDARWTCPSTGMPDRSRSGGGRCATCRRGCPRSSRRPSPGKPTPCEPVRKGASSRMSQRTDRSPSQVRRELLSRRRPV